MNKSLQLRYVHADHTRVLKDVRRDPSSEIIWKHIFYVGFSIKGRNDGNGHYHHALILADDYDSFLDGVAGEIKAISDH